MGMIRNYGCHCFPDYTRKTSGVGRPVNDVDGTCRDLNRCKKCIEIEGLSQDCENGDPDQGKYDKAFAENLAAVWTDASFDLQYWATIKNINAMNNAGTPVFDYDSTCTKIAGDVADACCGASYPNKQPYVSTNRECCADGSLKLFGSC